MPESPTDSYRHFTVRSEEGVLILTLTEANLRGYTVANALRRDFLAALQPGQTARVVLDLQNVKSLSSEAVRPLLTLQRRLRDSGGRLVLCNLAPVVSQCLTATRLVGGGTTSLAFEVAPDLPAAIALASSP